MKVNPEQIVNRLTNGAKGFSAALLFGPDQGLISETVARSVAAIAGEPADPFLIAEVTPAQLKGDEALLSDELSALPMVGTRKIIVIRRATDTIFKIVEAALAIPDAPNFLLIEAGELPARSKLRKAFEGAKTAGAAGCYADDRHNLEQIVRHVMDLREVSIGPEAAQELLSRLGNDRMISRGEIEKLALYAGDRGEIRVDDVIAMVGDNTTLSIDNVIFDTTDGDTRAADQALARALANGVAPVQILRALQTHFQRLHMVAGELQQGTSFDAAIGRLRPPIFFKVKSRFQRQCRQWSVDQLAAAMSLLLEAERQCKQTGAPMAAICQRSVLRLVAAARKGAGQRA